ncbi:MAG: J domain-containing protein [Deltaproteobacteria bacterium]|nr:J domain-containing protein [Deltaproteobacteria bacterium]
MYLSRNYIDHQTHYSIRETYQDGDYLKSRHLFNLGTDPSKFIIYPGGNGYYFDDAIQAALKEQGLNPTQDDLDPIFFEFLDPEIQRVIRGFERTAVKHPSHQSSQPQSLHLFDMRRLHFLKFGSMNQSQLQQVPAKFYRVLERKSRDELEQHFIMAERIIRPRELIRYLITIFDLQAAITDLLANPKKAGRLQSEMDILFLERVCDLFHDETFWSGMPSEQEIVVYLRRYMIFYFDQAGSRTPAIPSYLHDFINRHRTYRPPKAVRLNMQEASRLFDTSWHELKKMDLKTFTRLYRKQALKLHPDQGGSQKTFVKLSQIYQKLLKKKRRDSFGK